MSLAQIIAWFFLAFIVIFGTLVIGYYLLIFFIHAIGQGIWRMFQ
jgi:hypothetical protein